MSKGYIFCFLLLWSAWSMMAQSNPSKYKLQLQCTPANSGYVYGAGEYEAGTPVWVETYARSNFRFISWRENYDVVSNDSRFVYTMPDHDVVLASVFEYDPGNPGEPNDPSTQNWAIIALSQKGATGQTVSFPVFLLNTNIDVDAVRLEIQFPQEVLVRPEMASLSSRRNGQSLTITELGDNKFAINIDGSIGNYFHDSNGALIHIPVTLPLAWHLGDSYPVTLSNAFINSDSGEQSAPVKNGSIGIDREIDYSVNANFTSDVYLNRVSFLNLSSGADITYLWEFGDGATATQENPLHVYASSGNYEVKLTVSNAYASDNKTSSIQIIPESAWDVSGAFTLNRDKSNSKNFTEAVELFDFFSITHSTGNVLIQTGASQNFEITLNQTFINNLSTLTHQLEQNGYLLLFKKDGSGNNPQINFTSDGSPNSAFFEALVEWGNQVELDEVDISIFGQKINIDQIRNYKMQQVCPAVSSQTVDFSRIATGFTFQWELKNTSTEITGYTAQGTGNIPAMNLTNNSVAEQSLVYDVFLKLSGTTLYTFEYSFIVFPVLPAKIENVFPGQNAVESALSVEFSWPNIPTTKYDIYVWKDEENIPENPLASGLTALRYTLSNNYFEYGKKYKWKVIARNECGSTESDVISFSIRNLPDLHVTEINTSQFYSSLKGTVSWTVKNDGKGATVETSWTDRIWLISVIDDGTEAEYALLLKEVSNISGLGVGESYQNSAEVNIPEKIAGTYYILVTTDMYSAYSIDWSPTGNTFAPNPYLPSVTGEPYPYLFGYSYYYNQVNEESDNNSRSDNFFYKQVEIYSSPVPDLIVENATFQTSVFSGNKINISWSVKNQGIVAAEGQWQDAVYIGLNDEWDNSAIYLGRLYYEGILNPEASYNQTLEITIPNYLTGNYNVFIVTNAGDDVYERTGKENNTYKSSLQLQVILSPTPDLVVTGITAPQQVDVKGRATLKYQVSNQGAGATIEEIWEDAVYLSPTPVFDESTAVQLVTLWHRNNVEIDAGYEEEIGIDIPDGITGNWYWAVKVDIKGKVFEYQSKENNIFVRPEPVAVVYSDLTVSSVTIDKPLQGGEILTVSWQVENIGTGNVSNIKQSDYIYIASSATFNIATAILLDSLVYFNNLQSTENITQSKEVLIPCLTSGSYYLHVVSNVHHTVYEAGNTGNNTGSSALQPLLTNDLIVEQLSVSTTEIGSGQTLDLSGTIKKTGNGTIRNKPLKTVVYLSQNPLPDASITEIGAYSEDVNLQEGETKAFAYSITIPNGISGIYYIGVRVNPDEKICESSFENNAKNSQAIAVTLSPSPDLQVADLIIPTDLKAGAILDIQYSVENKGVGNTSSKTWKDRLFISSKSQLDVLALSLKEIRQNRSLETNESYEEVITVQIPPSLAPGNYYILAFTDEEDEIYEHQAEDNNIRIAGPIYVQPYPLDIVAENLTVPATPQWSETVPVTFTVKNNSEEKTVQTQWLDAIYLSSKNILDNTAVLLKERKHIGALASGEQYMISENVLIPNGYEGNQYILGVADAKEINYDINRENNTAAKVIAILSVPTPDLIVEEFQVVGNPVSGQPFQVVYTIKNNGDGAIDSKTWNNKIYLSDNVTWNEQNEQLKNTLVQNKSLASGESYTEETSVTIALPKTGNFILFLQIDANNALYEHGGEDNNLANRSVVVNLPLPGDLAPENIQLETQLISGNYLHVAWNISNKGDNAVNSSNLKDLVYLSLDTQFDASDKLIGQVSSSVSIPAYGSVERQLTSRISGVKEGEYYLLVKTDVMNSVNESDKINNTAYSAYPVKIELRELPVNTKVDEVLTNNVSSEWKLSSDGIVNETVVVQALSADSLKGAVNNLYIKHNDVADNINYDFSSDGQFTANPQLYISSVQSEYYGINVSGETPAGNEQNIELQAEVLPFEIRSVSPDYGGNTGRVTVELSGAKFTPEMEVWLERDSIVIDADTLIYVGFHKVFAVFDLDGQTIGKYSLNAFNFCEGEFALEDGFEIRNESPYGLATNLILPGSSRPNRVVSITFEYANTGNTDILHPVVDIYSHAASPIGLSQASLNENKTILSIALQAPGEPEGVLRPGSGGTVTFYAYTSGGLIFTIEKR